MGKAEALFLARLGTSAAHDEPWPFAKAYGYGEFWAGGKVRYVHREACRLAYGDPPSGKPFACHTCLDRRDCFWSEHLYWGDHVDNGRDMIADGHSTRGERSGRARLSARDVLEIRQQHATGDWSLSALGVEFGVTKSAIADVLARRSWVWL